MRAANLIMAFVVTLSGLTTHAVHAAVGRTEGAFSVSADGAATYSIPIWMPAGPRGMTPALALGYNSLGGNGPLGVGWSLAGLKSIDRCPRTSAPTLDDSTGPIVMGTADRYCLGTTRLRLKSGAYGAANSTYALEIDDFSTFTASSSLQGAGPTSFTVVSKSGITYEYGATANARVTFDANGTVLRWMLNKVQDQAGNSYVIDYAVSDAVAVPTTISWGPTSAGGSSYRFSAVLTYEDKSNEKDWSTWYVAGRQATSKKRLTSISIRQQTTTVRKYVLAYEAAPLTMLSRLVSVRECSNEAASDCLQPTAFTYQSGRAPSSTSANVNLTIGGLIVGAADFNGDNKDDLIYTVGAQWYVLFGSNGGFGSPVTVTGLTGNFGVTVDYDVFLPGNRAAFIANIGGTLYTFTANEAGTAFTQNSTGLTFTQGSIPVGVRDRSGLANLVWATWDNPSQQHRTQFINNVTQPGATAPQFVLGGSGHSVPAWVQPTGSQEGKVRPGSLRIISDRGLEHRDVDGDGYADVYAVVDVDYCQQPPNDHICGWGQPFLFKYLLGGREPALASTWKVYSGSYPSITIDFNDDGCSDTPNAQSVCWPSGETPITPPVSGGFWMDWDGDGRSDLAYDNGGNVGVYLSTGRGFTSPISTSIPYASNFRVLDIDGDGLDDLARMEANVLRIHTRNAAGAATTTLSQFPDLLTSVVDGLGVSQSVTYVSTAHSNYSPGVQVPGLTPARARIVVSAATLPTGIVNPSTYMVTYSYVGAREDVLRATFMGFQEQHITDTRTNVLTRTYFRQAFPQTGWVWKTETFRDGDIKLAAHEITDDNIATLVSTNYRQRYFPYVESVRSEAYEPEGTERLITRSETTYGGIDTTNGNVGTITTSVEDGDGVTQWSSTTSIQYAPATTGCADLPSQISVTLDRTATPDPPAITRTVDFTKDGTHCRHRTQTLQGSSDKFDVTTTFGYDSFGNVSSTSVVAQEPSLADPNTYQPMPARQNTIYWGVYGLAPEAITNAVNETSLLGYYQTTGLLQSLTDPNGLVTSLEFDGFGRLTKQTRPDQTSIDLQYADCSGTTGCLSGTLHRMNVVQTERDATSAAVRQQYAYLDSFGRTLVTRSEALNGNFRWSEVQYDLLGRIAKSSIPCLSSAATGRCVQAWREFTSYDLLGRIKRIEQPANENEISRELVTLISYDGLTRTVTDPLSRTTSLRTDVSGNIVRSTDANGYYQNFFYDSAGNLTEVRESPQPGRSAVLFSATYDHGIDAFQRSISDRALGARTRWFDGFGQLRRWTDAKGQVFEASYDALSRPTIRREGVVSPSAQEMKITLTWGTNPALYNIGQIVSARSESVDGTYIENYGYDSRGRLSSHSISVPGEPTPYVYNYEYDSLTGLLETLTYPASTSGYRLALRYNTVGGILRSITDANAPSTVFWSLNDAQGGINALGQITHDRLGPIVRERQYDAVTGGLERLTAGSSGNPTALQNLSVGYDDFGNVWQRQNNLGSLTASLTENFRYGRSGVDLIDRLTQIDVTNAEGTRTRDIEHDAFGNIEMVTTPDSATPPDLLPVDLTFTWTSNNYPKTISAPWLSQNVSFAYGPHQQRWRMTFQEGETTETTYYLGMMEKVVTGTGTEFRHYIPGPDEIVALYARSGSSGSLRYVLSDHLGSVDTITDSAGAALVRSSFAAYGRPRDPADWWGDPGSTASGFTRQGFTFHTVLAGMGLIHMNGRVHDAVSGTFISADPFVPYPTNTQSFNRYAYVRNNPLTYTDPTGFQDGRGCQGCMWGMVGDDISGMGPLEWGWALWEVYGGWSGYLWNVGGIDTGDYDCKGTYEECSRGWVASEFYTNEVTNPQHREFPAERRANTNVAAGTVNPGVDRRSSTAADSTVGGIANDGVMNPIYVPQGTVTMGLPRFVYQQCAMTACHGNDDLPYTHGWLSDEESREFALSASLTVGTFAVSGVFTAARGLVVISDAKLGYLLGHATGRAHNIERTLQNAVQLGRVGVHDTAAGRALLRSHFEGVAASRSNILRSFTNEYGVFQVRESLFAGPGGFLKFESTWQVLPGGGSRLVTAIPFGGL